MRLAEAVPRQPIGAGGLLEAANFTVRVGGGGGGGEGAQISADFQVKLYFDSPTKVNLKPVGEGGGVSGSRDIVGPSGRGGGGGGVL